MKQDKRYKIGKLTALISISVTIFLIMLYILLSIKGDVVAYKNKGYIGEEYTVISHLNSDMASLESDNHKIDIERREMYDKLPEIGARLTQKNITDKHVRFYEKEVNYNVIQKVPK